MGSDKMEFVFGAGLGVAAGLILAAVMVEYTKKDGKKCKFDERQELVRGRGFKYGFFAVLIFGAFEICFGELLEAYVQQEVIHFMGLIFGIIVYALYAIWNDGYFALNENPKRVMLMLFLVSVMNFVVAWWNIRHGEMVTDDILTLCSLNLICGIVMLLLMLVILFKFFFLSDAKEEEQ